MKIVLLLIMAVSLWANIGNIMAMKGSVEVERSQKSLPATNGMVLLEGDNIVTAAKSRVQVMLQDSTIITIGANSSFSFEEYLFNGTKESKLTMRAKRGFFRSVTGSIGKIAPERFKVKTASATIGIRGTDFSGDIGVQRELFRCYEGAIFIEYEGSRENVDAGMMAEIANHKVEVKKIDIPKLKTATTPKTLKGTLTDALGDTNVATETIADVTQVIENNELNEETLPALEVVPTVEDRQTEY